MAGKGWRKFPGPLPGTIQLVVCLAFLLIGFDCEDLKSWCMFLYVFHSIMSGFQALFPHDYDEFAIDGHWFIVGFNAVIDSGLQLWSFIHVLVYVCSKTIWQFDIESCEKRHTIIICAFGLLIIEGIFLVSTFVKIYRQWGARKSKRSLDINVQMSALQTEDPTETKNLQFRRKNVDDSHYREKNIQVALPALFQFDSLSIQNEL